MVPFLHLFPHHLNQLNKIKMLTATWNNTKVNKAYIAEAFSLAIMREHSYSLWYNIYEIWLIYSYQADVNSLSKWMTQWKLEETL